MSFHPPRNEDRPLTRREMLARSGLGFGAMALGGLLTDSGMIASSARAAEVCLSSVAPVASVRAQGEAGHSPVHERGAFAGRYVRPEARVDQVLGQVNSRVPPHRTQDRRGAAARPFKFQKYGQSGLEVSELFAKVGECTADDLCVIRSMHADVPNHEPSLMLMNCGEARQPRPSMGSWVLYGLGTENQNLPGLRGHVSRTAIPIAETQNWQSAFLARHLSGHVYRHASIRTSRS